MNKTLKEELTALDTEMLHKEQEIIDEWKKHNKPPYGYGIIEPEKQKALMKEHRIRAGAIINKYKQLR